MHNHHQAFKKGFTLVELLVVIAIIGILIGMLLPAVQQVREASRRISCANNTKNVALALLNYESANKVFPSGYLARDGRATNQCVGWATLILPYMEQKNIYDQLTDDIDNQVLAEAIDVSIKGQQISPYICPSSTLDDVDPSGAAKCNFAGNQGTQNNTADSFGIFEHDSNFGFGDISDGTSNTILIGEVEGSAKESNHCFPVWIGPQDGSLSFARRTVMRRGDYRQQMNANSNTDVTDKNPAVFSSRHTGGVNHAFVDGSVHFLSDAIEHGSSNNDPNGAYLKLIHRQDGQVVGSF